MSSCDLEIVLERPDATYKLGEAVRGVVGVTVDKACRCTALTVWVEWYTHGSGNETRGTASQQVLFEGEWKAGDKALHPFELTVGKGPLPYHGHHLNVDWRVAATAAIPWGFDPRADAELIVADDPALPELDHGPLSLAFAGRETASMVVSVIVGVAFLAFPGVFLLVAPVVALTFATEGQWLVGLGVGAVILAVPLIFMALGATFLLRAFGPRLAARRLGQPVVQLSPTRLRGGEELAVRVTMTPPKTTPVGGIYALLTARERCVSGSGTHARTHTQELFTERIPLGTARTLQAGLPAAFEGRARMPERPPPSFAATDNALEWTVEVHAELPRGPDWVSRHPLTVRP